MTNGIKMEEFKRILKLHGLSGSDIALLLGLSYSSYRSIMSRGYKNGSPRWVKSFMLGYSLGLQDGQDILEKKSDAPRVGSSLLAGGSVVDSDMG